MMVVTAQASDMESATFGLGCFWGPELAFQRVPGVLATAVGYSQGAKPGVTYEQVCSGITGHTEVVQVWIAILRTALRRRLMPGLELWRCGWTL